MKYRHILLTVFVPMKANLFIKIKDNLGLGLLIQRGPGSGLGVSKALFYLLRGN